MFQFIIFQLDHSQNKIAFFAVVLFNKNIAPMSINLRAGRADKGNWHNPESNSKTRMDCTRQRSAFLTEFDEMQKTRALWRNLQPIQKKNKMNKEINSWSDLNKLKIKYRTQLFRNKNSDQIFQENMSMILKIQETPPSVDTWNHLRPKRTSPRSSSQELALKNLELLRKIRQAQAKIEDWNLYKHKKSPRANERSERKLKLFEENMKIIDRIESTSPKVEVWSQLKPKRNKKLILERSLQKQKLFQENMKLIEKVESVPPKVESWADIRSMRHKVLQKRAQSNRSMEELQRMKKIIEDSELKLAQRQIEQIKKKKINATSSTIPVKLLKQREHLEAKVQLMALKVQKVKCAVNCWTQKETKNDNRGALNLAEDRRKLRHINKNLQMPFTMRLKQKSK